MTTFATSTPCSCPKGLRIPYGSTAVADPSTGLLHRASSCATDTRTPSPFCECGNVPMTAGQKPVVRDSKTHTREACTPLVGTTHVECPACSERFWVLGETPEKRARAVAEWDGCGCAEEGAA